MKDYTTANWSSHPVIGQEWDQVVNMLPIDLDETARADQAFQRQREVHSATDLLRLVLAYALCDWPLRAVAAWATIIELAYLSDVALLNRLQGARKWLGRLVATCLLSGQLALAQPEVRVRLVDATSLSRPGSSGTDWRLHLSFNLTQLRLDAITLTDARGGESLVRYAIQPGEIIVGDRGYARQVGFGQGLAAQGQLVIRIGWSSLLLEALNGQRLDLFAWLRQGPAGGPQQREVWVTIAKRRYRLRLIAQRLSPQAVEKARRRIRKRAQKSGRTPRQETLAAAAYIMLVTNLPAADWPAAEVLQLYRIRWQVELAIKRLKSIWHLDHLRAKDSDLAQTYLLGKLLGALLGQALTGQVQAYFPEWFEDLGRPPSLWRLQGCWLMWVRRAVVGQVTLAAIRKALPRLQRYLRDSPRKKRRQQLAHAHAWICHLNEPVSQEFVGYSNKGGI